MKGRVIAILESRLGSQFGDVIARRGGVPLLAPALAEVPDLETAFVRQLIADALMRPPKVALFQTGVGTQALFRATDVLGVTPDLLKILDGCIVAVRGPKPTGALRSRGIRIDLTAAEPYTTTEVLGVLADVSLSGQSVIVQRYGGPNPELDRALEARGATVVEIPVYRWAMPEDTGPLQRLLDELSARRVDALAFTSASQVRNLCAYATQQGRHADLMEDARHSLVASIGPVCSAALRAAGFDVALEASPPKLGPLVNALDEALSA